MCYDTYYYIHIYDIIIQAENVTQDPVFVCKEEINKICNNISWYTIFK